MDHFDPSMNRSPAGELARLDAHFVRVLRTLRARPPSRLSRAQNRARATHLDRLEGYRRRALFPKNKRFPGRMLPHFIDDAGTRCAMGHLIELGGGRDLVHHIARYRNCARVRELADIPELLVWLDANGLTAAEAAMIQPEYCGPPAHNCLCGGAFGSGLIEGTLGDGGASLKVTAVYGPFSGGVLKGDIVVVQDTRGVGTAFDVVFATPGVEPRTAYIAFGAKNGDVTIPTTACFFPQVAVIPGTLPLATVENALSASTEPQCEAVLVAHDPAWGVMQGGLDCTQNGSGGAGSSSDATTSSTGGRPSADAGNATSGAASDASGSCAFSTRAPGNAGVAVALSVALLVLRARRARI